jgi:hypothetical protein
VSSRLLPHHAQVATHKPLAYTCLGSNLMSVGSRQVAGWVAGWIWKISLTYGSKRLTGSRCSIFINKLRVEKKRRYKERIGITIGISCYTCYLGARAEPSNVGAEA